METNPSLTVIVPVYNGGKDLAICLNALTASEHRPQQIILADDGSTDDSANIAREKGAEIVTVPGGPRGPAVARNLGAKQATGDILLFVDADVAVHPDTLGKIVQYFAAEPELAALFGSYDDDPPAPALASRYKNLLHHYVHQTSRREATTFWAGCGAVRRTIYESVGGFDEGYARPSIEDIALGLKLHQMGRRIWLCADVQVTHLKRWTLKSVVRTDIFCRAIPWSQLIVQSGSVPNDLNLNAASRLSAVAAWLAVLLTLATPFVPLLSLGVLAILILVAALNAPLLRFFARRGGVFFAFGAFWLHLLYYLYSSAIFGVLLIASKLRPPVKAPLTPH